MNKKQVRHIAICEDQFNTEEEFWTTVNNLIKGLVDSDHITSCYWDDKGVGVFIIQFDDKDPEIADFELKWTPVEE